MLESLCILNFEGEEEDDTSMLRSILAQLEYQYQVISWDDKGVPFRTYIYVPEVHPITMEEYHEREDFAHVLKVISNKATQYDVVMFSVL